MKKNVIVTLSILLASGLWLSSERQHIAPTVAKQRAIPSPIIIYTTDWCNFCDSLRTTLKQYKISYDEYDVEQSEKGRLDYEKLGAGGVPIIVIGKHTLYGYDGQELTDALIDNGYEIPTTWD